MNLVLDTLKSRRSFMLLGNFLGFLACAGLFRTLCLYYPFQRAALGVMFVFIFELVADLFDRRTRRLRELAPTAFPFKNLSEDDRNFLQGSLMRIPKRAGIRALAVWSAATTIVVILHGVASFTIAGLIFGMFVSFFSQIYGNAAMGRRVTPFYYFDGDSPDQLSKILPSMRRNLFLWTLAPSILFAVPLLAITNKSQDSAIVGWILIWGCVAAFAALRLFQDLVVAPIEDLGSALGRFGEGDFSALLDVTSGDALGVTTNLYNKTVRKIDRRFFVRENFGHMIAGEKTEELFEGGLKLDGEEREIAVLVARVTGHGLSLKAFNKFCDSVIESVNKHGGAMDEVSDGYMVALFNAPLKIENAEGAGLEAAKEIKERLEVFKAQQKMQAGLSLQIGLGFASGEAMVGLLGPRGRQRYTAMGKPVEEARKLAGL